MIKNTITKFYDYFCFFVSRYFNKYICRVSILLVLFICFGNKSSHHKCSFKKVFLKILQISQEKNCLGVSFNKVAGLKICNFTKKETSPNLFSCKYREIFKNRFFYGIALMAASENG